MAQRSTKLFKGFPNAYRNPNSPGDCHLLHGYSREFYFVFEAEVLDKQGFVVDFGGLKNLKHWLDYNFDHTVLMQADDPLVPTFQELDAQGACALRLFPLVSCEGIAMYVGLYAQELVNKLTEGRAGVVSCEVREDFKNSAIWHRGDSITQGLKFSDLEKHVQDMLAGGTMYVG